MRPKRGAWIAWHLRVALQVSTRRSNLRADRERIGVLSLARWRSQISFRGITLIDSPVERNSTCA